MTLQETVKETGLYTSFEVNTLEDKKKLYNALNTKLESLSEHVNEDVEVTAIIVTPATFKDDEKDEDKDGWKIVLTLKGGKMVTCSGNAVLQNLDNAVTIFGVPTEKDPMKFRVVENKSGRNAMYKYISLKIV
jgi:hypothetical protein